VEEAARRGLEDARDAVIAPAQLVVAAEDVLADAELDEAAEKEVDEWTYIGLRCVC